MMENSKILSFKIESPLYEAYEQFCQEHRFRNVSASMRYIVKTAIQTDNLIKNRETDIDPNIPTALDRLSIIEKQSLLLTLMKDLGEREVDRIRRLAELAH